MANEIENRILLKAAARNLWGRFCGISDEYRTLRERWEYLRPRTSGALPDISDPTFSALEKVVKDVRRLFRNAFCLERATGEQVIEISTRTPLEELSEIRKKLFDFTTYVNLLKQSFYQRTVSLEIPHVASGVPHSPERSIGNEAVYVAADKICTYYANNLVLHTSKWDGIVSYLIAPTEEQFYGAFMRPTETLDLFHVSMSDEMKYFLPSYLVLGHEMAHECARSIPRYEEFIPRSGDFPLKDHPLSRAVFTFYIGMLKYYKEHGGGNYHLPEEKDEMCAHCLFSESQMNSGASHEKLDRMFTETLCDIIASRVGGICTMLHFMDYGVNNPFSFYRDEEDRLVYEFRGERITRLSGTMDHLSENGVVSARYRDLLSMSFLREEIEKERTFFARSTNDNEVYDRALECIDCVERVGKNFSTAIRDYNSYHRREFGSPVFSLITRGTFEISKEKEDHLMNLIEEGEPVMGSNPAEIMHVYYLLFRQGRVPSYPATLFSLANSSV
jgi:hypothetical protein